MKLYSKIYGDKAKDLIVIHGLFGMSDNWNSLGRKFSEYFRVHLIDLRNHGRSPHSVNFNYDVMCDDLLEYMINHNIQKPIILGHSLGGKVAMKFAFTFPKKIEKLLVADISPREYNSDFYKSILAILYKIPLEDFDKREDIDSLLSSLYEDKGMRLFLMKNLYRDENKKFAWRFNIEILLDKIENIEEANFIKGICNVSTHFIKGGNSNYITNEDRLIIGKHFSNFGITNIDGAGHWLHAEEPRKFYNEVVAICGYL